MLHLEKAEDSIMNTSMDLNTTMFKDVSPNNLSNQFNQATNFAANNPEIIKGQINLEK